MQPRRTAYSYARFSTLQQEEGDSERRQMEDARAYAAVNGFDLDESLGVDQGRSAYHGKNLSEGALGEFIKRIEAAEIPRGSALIVESPDRLSRQPFSECWPTYQRILNGDIEIHFLFIRRLLKPNHSFVDLLQIGIEIDRGNSESANKSDRIGKAWRIKKSGAIDGKAITASVPHWLRAEKGETIVEIPERAAAIRKIFRLAALGLGGTRIIRQLIKDGDKPFGTSKKWTLGYIQMILTNRAVLGEYQPYRHENGHKIAEGDPIPCFYPSVVSPTEWAEARQRIDAKTIAGKNGRGGIRGDNVCNLFTGLIRDTTADERTMNFNSKGAGTRPAYFVTAFDVKGNKCNRMRYNRFETAFLGFLEDLDWKSIAGQSELPEIKEKQVQLDAVLAELYRMERVAAKFDALTNDPDLDTKFVLGKLQAANQKIATLNLKRDSLTSDIAGAQSQADALSQPEQLLKVIRGGDSEVRLRLKSEIAKRIARIDLTFNATVLTDGPVDVEAGTGKIVAKISFINGAAKWIFFQGDRAVLLS